MSSDSVLVVDVKGNPRQRGRQQGEGARSRIAGMIDAYRELLPAAVRRSWERVQQQAYKYLSHAEVAFPQFVDELRGIAEGAGVSFEEAWVLNCAEEVIDSRRSSGCTTLAVRDDLTVDGHVLLAHNEDWTSVDRDHIYLVRAEPEDGPPFLAMTYGPLLVNVGLNGEGIGVGINSVYPTDGRIGVPRILFSRAILGARAIGQAIAACLFRERAGGYHNLLADANGELYSVETSATEHAILYGEEGWLVHTNHYLSPRLQAVERPGGYVGSQVRYHRARRLLQGQLGLVTRQGVQEVLRDHVNRPYSICGHEDLSRPPHDRDQTVLSLVMDLTERRLWAAPGPPCEGEYTAFSL